MIDLKKKTLRFFFSIAVLKMFTPYVRTIKRDYELLLTPETIFQLKVFSELLTRTTPA